MDILKMLFRWDPLLGGALDHKRIESFRVSPPPDLIYDLAFEFDLSPLVRFLPEPGAIFPLARLKASSKYWTVSLRGKARLRFLRSKASSSRLKNLIRCDCSKAVSPAVLAILAAARRPFWAALIAS